MILLEILLRLKQNITTGKKRVRDLENIAIQLRIAKYNLLNEQIADDLDYAEKIVGIVRKELEYQKMDERVINHLKSKKMITKILIEQDENGRFYASATQAEFGEAGTELGTEKQEIPLTVQGKVEFNLGLDHQTTWHEIKH